MAIGSAPTAGSVQARILDLLREFGFACLFISHDLAVIEQLADRVAVMHRGHVVEQGPTKEVLTAPAHPYTRRLLSASPAPARRPSDGAAKPGGSCAKTASHLVVLRGGRYR